MDKTMERSMMQTLFKYLPGAYADFNLEGYSVTARIFGWNAEKSTSENKTRITYEISARVQQYMYQNASANIPESKHVAEQYKFFDSIMEKGKEAFDVYYLRGKKNDNDKFPEIISVVRPYVFYCTKCQLIHIITDYNLTGSSEYLDAYKYRIKEVFDYKRHRCMKCNGLLKQQQIIRIDALGNAYDYEPKCDTHLQNTEYYIKKSSVFDYRCSKCENTVERRWNAREKLTSALDPNAFFPHIFSIVDTKNDVLIKEITTYPELSKLLILREMNILSKEKYPQKKTELINLHKEYKFNCQSLAYRQALRKKGIEALIKTFNEPSYSTYAQKNPNAFYANVANRLIDIIELQDRCSIDQATLLKTIREESNEFEYEKTTNFLKKLMIEDIYISEDVPITNIAYGYTRVSPEVGFNLPDQAILNVYKDNEDRYKFYSTKLYTEGVYIKFETQNVLDWLKDSVTNANHDKIFVFTHENPSIDLFNNYIRDGSSNIIVTSVLHTISHIFIKQIALVSGLEVSSLSEMIFPEVLGIFIYSTSNEGVILNSIKTAVVKRLSLILKKSLDAIYACSLKSICNTKDVSACLGCLFISELSCSMHNHYLNRKYLNAYEQQTHISETEPIFIKRGLWT